jgi:ribosomal protein L15E
MWTFPVLFQFKRGLITRRRILSKQSNLSKQKPSFTPIKTSKLRPAQKLVTKEKTPKSARTTSKTSRGIKYRNLSVTKPFCQQYKENITESDILALGFTPLPAIPLAQVQ